MKKHAWKNLKIIISIIKKLMGGAGQVHGVLGGGCQPKWMYSINLIFMSNKALNVMFDMLLWQNQGFGVSFVYCCLNLFINLDYPETLMLCCALAVK